MPQIHSKQRPRTIPLAPNTTTCRDRAETALAASSDLERILAALARRYHEIHQPDSEISALITGANRSFRTLKNNAVLLYEEPK